MRKPIKSKKKRKLLAKKQLKRALRAKAVKAEKYLRRIQLEEKRKWIAKKEKELIEKIMESRSKGNS